MKKFWIINWLIIFSLVITASAATRKKDEVPVLNVNDNTTTTNNIIPSHNLVEQKIETNGWNECILNFKKGLFQIGVMGNLYVTGDPDMSWNIPDCANVYIGNAIIEPSDDMFSVRCRKEHLTDYPKTNDEVVGVQKYRVYAQTVSIEGKTIETKWKIYSYPHEKITETTVVKMVKVSDISTNKVDIVEPHACVICGEGGLK